MKYRRLGKTDIEVSEVSFGGHQTDAHRLKRGTPAKQRVKVIERGLELGISYFDTTIDYEAESLSSVFGLMGGKPDNVTVSCMYTDYKLNHEVVEGIGDRITASIDDNLQYFDPIDVFNLCGNGFPYSRQRTLRAIEALEQAREQGKVKHFGFSTHTMRYALEMIENHPELCLIMFPFNVVLPRIAEILFPVAKQHDVAVVGMKAFGARGLFDVEIHAEDYGTGVSLPAAAVKWVLQHPEVSCTIPAMNSVDEVEEDTGASGSGLTDGEARMLDDLRDAFDHKVSTDPSWYYHRDWTRQLYGETPDPAEPHNGEGSTEARSAAGGEGG